MAPVSCNGCLWLWRLERCAPVVQQASAAAAVVELLGAGDVRVSLCALWVAGGCLFCAHGAHWLLVVTVEAASGMACRQVLMPTLVEAWAASLMLVTCVRWKFVAV